MTGNLPIVVQNRNDICPLCRLEVEHTIGMYRLACGHVYHVDCLHEFSAASIAGSLPFNCAGCTVPIVRSMIVFSQVVLDEEVIDVDAPDVLPEPIVLPLMDEDSDEDDDDDDEEVEVIDVDAPTLPPPLPSFVDLTIDMKD